MKRLLVVLLIIGFVVTPLLTDEKETLEKVGQFLRQNEFDKALDVLNEALKTNQVSKNLFRLKYLILVRTGKIDEALSFVETGIQSFGENPDLLVQKLFLLMKQKKYDKALKFALRKDEITPEKNPFDCLDIMEVYLKLNNKDKAFEWLNTAVDRGFTSIKTLQTDDFKPLLEDSRFEKIRARINEKIGLGKTARDFTVSLLRGGNFQLSKQKKNVVLIDFWATWCGPCRQEIPNLKKYYLTFKDKGLKIIGISLDKDENKLKEYLEKEKLPWDISYSGKFWNDDTASLYGINAIPSYWLIDRKGILRYSGLVGAELEKAIAELIAEK